MKFNIDTKAFLNAATAVSRVLSTKSPLPILSYFLLNVQGDKMIIRATDSECTITNTIDLPGAEEDGQICIDATQLMNALHEMPDGDMTFAVAEGTNEIHIDYEGGEANVVGLPGDQFPDIRKDPSDANAGVTNTLRISAQAFIRGLQNTVFAVASDDFRPMMTGICLDFKDDRLVFAATDAHKLARYIDENIKPGFERSSIMPARSAQIINNIFSEADEVEVTINDIRCIIESKDRIFTFPFIKGRFPDYNRVIPTDNPFTLAIDRPSFLAATKRMKVFVDKGTELLRIDIDPDHIELIVQDVALNSNAREKIPASYDGSSIITAFKTGNLIEILSTLTTPDVLVKVKDPTRAVIFLPAVNDPGTDLVILLMPMQAPTA